MQTEEDIINQLDALLPQTQCQRCTYQDCRSYAQALARGQARTNQCPPGGQATADKLASFLQQAPLKLDSSFGEITVRKVAFIEEKECIGCALCLKKCPVDAIIGSNKMLHTVFYDKCTGCDLCLDACPVDCISTARYNKTWNEEEASAARSAYLLHLQRKQS